MRFKLFTLFTGFILFISFCFAFTTHPATEATPVAINTATSTIQTVGLPAPADPVVAKPEAEIVSITTNPADRRQLVAFAKQFLGVPYVYGSTDPRVGFDCSGFVNHVARHFGIDVPRSSVQFTNIGQEIPAPNAQAGDIILFTGTDPQTRVVGHMGIVTENPGGNLTFIHSSSGKAKGVTESTLDDYYKTRFVKVIRLFSPTTEMAA